MGTINCLKDLTPSDACVLIGYGGGYRLFQKHVFDKSLITFDVGIKEAFFSYQVFRCHVFLFLGVNNKNNRNFVCRILFFSTDDSYEVFDIFNKETKNGNISVINENTFAYDDKDGFVKIFSIFNPSFELSPTAERYSHYFEGLHQFKIVNVSFKTRPNCVSTEVILDICVDGKDDKIHLFMFSPNSKFEDFMFSNYVYIDSIGCYSIKNENMWLTYDELMIDLFKGVFCGKNYCSMKKNDNIDAEFLHDFVDKLYSGCDRTTNGYGFKSKEKF